MMMDFLLHRGLFLSSIIDFIFSLDLFYIVYD